MEHRYLELAIDPAWGRLTNKPPPDLSLDQRPCFKTRTIPIGHWCQPLLRQTHAKSRFLHHASRNIIFDILPGPGDSGAIVSRCALD
jgi:hypothetical protein